MNTKLFLPSDPISKDVVAPHLTHGSNIVTIVTGDENLADCDALITESREFSLGIKTADCASICFSDGKKIGIAHIGWRGLCLGLIEKMLTHFDTANLSIYVAPFLHSFEIQKDFCYEQLSQKFGQKYFSEEGGKLIFNFKYAINSLLPSQTQYDARDTESDLTFPSYRRDKTTERFVTVVRFQ